MEVAAGSQPVVQMANNDANGDARDETAAADARTRTPENEAPPVVDLEDATLFSTPSTLTTTLSRTKRSAEKQAKAKKKKYNKKQSQNR